eukprot:12916245-Prorocentrum_lima.AAC.1
MELCVQCPHGGNLVTVLPNPGQKAPCPQRIYVHRCMKVADATEKHDLLLRLQDHRLAALYTKPPPQATRDPGLILDFACGIGGFTEAAKALGMRVEAAVDINPQILTTYKHLWGTDH